MNLRKIPCVLLCGGASTRMGVDKCFLNINGKSLVRWQFERLLQIFDKVYISAKFDKFDGEFKDLILDEIASKMQTKHENLTRNLSENFKLNEKIDENLKPATANFTRQKDENFSPMIALMSILRHFKKGFVFIIAVDSPFISKNCIETMYLQRENNQIIVPRTENKVHFLSGFYESELLPLCEKLLSQKIHKIRALSEMAPTKFVKFEDEKDFINLNTKKDYEDFLKCV